MNFLFLAGSHRVTLARHFIASGKRRNVDVHIFGYNSQSQVPLAEVGHIVPARPWNDPHILTHLRDVVETYNINALIPFDDDSIQVAAQFIDHYNDVYAPLTTVEQVATLTDKIAAARVMENLGLPIPSVYRNSRPLFPIIARPRRSNPRQPWLLIDTVPAFKRIVMQRDQYLLQNFIEDKDEFTIDCFVARTGEPLCVSPRQRLRIIDGQVTSTITVASPALRGLSLQILSALRLRGAVTIQIVRDRHTRELYLIDVHPRLANGVACSIVANADIPGMIIDEVREIAPRPAQNVVPGYKVVRYLEDVVFPPPTSPSIIESKKKA